MAATVRSECLQQLSFWVLFSTTGLEEPVFTTHNDRTETSVTGTCITNVRLAARESDTESGKFCGGI